MKGMQDNVQLGTYIHVIQHRMDIMLTSFYDPQNQQTVFILNINGNSTLETELVNRQLPLRNLNEHLELLEEEWDSQWRLVA